MTDIEEHVEDPNEDEPADPEPKNDRIEEPEEEPA